MKILIVDDERDYRMLLESFLQEQGWSVVQAEHGQDALDRLRDQKIDLVISDIYMPVMDGMKFHKNVRDILNLKTLPFLFVSAYDDQYTLDAVKDSKYDGFVRKGRTLSELKAWIVYLTTPVEKRPSSPPGVSTISDPLRWKRDTDRPKRRQ